MKTISMAAPDQVLQALCESIRVYADAAYPIGGSECAQVARTALLDAAEQIDKQLQDGQNKVTISRRIKSHAKAAINYQQQNCIEQNIDEGLCKQRAGILLSMLNGKVIQTGEWR